MVYFSLEQSHQTLNIDSSEGCKSYVRDIEKPTSSVDSVWLYDGEKDKAGHVHVEQRNILTDKSICGYCTTAYIFNRSINLSQQPFLHFAKDIECVANNNAALFSMRFANFRNLIIDPSLGHSDRKGGERMEDVWNQQGSSELLTLSPGYFRIQCDENPSLEFLPQDHLLHWAKALTCYNSTHRISLPHSVTTDFVLAIQRYEYVNLYHTMCDFYNAFVLMLIFGVRPSKMNILFIDSHPAGNLDDVWSTLFGKVQRAGHIKETTLFHNLAWGLMGYLSPLNQHYLLKVPYLDEFRQFFLTQHNVSTSHQLNCQKVKVVFIWRHDYIAHPRNKLGTVVRKFANEAELLQHASHALGPAHNVTGHQLDQLSMRSQLELISQCDILVGMHGAGLSHILFLPNTSAVLELKPNYSPAALKHFWAMAHWRDLKYSMWHNENRGNEMSSYRTNIPKDVIETEISQLYRQICST